MILAIILGVLLVAVTLYAGRLLAKVKAHHRYNTNLFLRAATLQTERDLIQLALAEKLHVNQHMLQLIIRAVEKQEPELLKPYPKLHNLYYQANKMNTIK